MHAEELMLVSYVIFLTRHGVVKENNVLFYFILFYFIFLVYHRTMEDKRQCLFCAKLVLKNQYRRHCQSEKHKRNVDEQQKKHVHERIYEATPIEHESMCQKVAAIEACSRQMTFKCTRACATVVTIAKAYKDLEAKHDAANKDNKRIYDELRTENLTLQQDMKRMKDRLDALEGKELDKN
jgi:hypothetical protein